MASMHQIQGAEMHEASQSMTGDQALQAQDWASAKLLICLGTSCQNGSASQSQDKESEAWTVEDEQECKKNSMRT